MADKPANQETLDWYLKSWTDEGYQGWMVREFVRQTGLTLSEGILFMTFLDATVQAKALAELAPLQKKVLEQHSHCSDDEPWNRPTE